MSLKCAIVQQAARTTTGDQSFTDSDAGFSSDVKAALFFSSVATAVDTNTGTAKFSFGAMCAGGTKCALSIILDGTNRLTRAETSHAYCVADASIGSSCEFAPHASSPFLSNGVQVTYSDAASEAHLVTALLLGGEIEANIIVVDFATASSVTGVSHGLSGTPELIIALSNFDPNGLGGQSDVYYSVGFWDGTNYVSHCGLPTGGSAVAGRISTAALVGKSGSDGTIATGGYLTLANVGASTLDVSANTTVDYAVALICIRGTTDAISVKCGTLDSPTSTGNQAVGAALATAPQVLLTLGSRFTANDTGSSTDTAGQFGAFAACNNAGAGTQYGGSVGNSNDVDTVTSWTTAGKAFVATTGAGAADAEATVNAWGASDVTLNFSNVAASALKIPYLAFGVAAATKYLKLLAHPSAAGATGVSGVVFASSAGLAGAEIGEFTGAAFEATTEGTGDNERAVLLVPVADFGGSALTTSDTPVAVAKNTTHTTGLVSCTVVEV